MLNESWTHWPRSAPELTRLPAWCRGGYSDPDHPMCYYMQGYDDICAPSWVIIGTLKSGSTSMYSYLTKHPQVEVRGPMHDKANDESENKGARGGGGGRKVKPVKFKEVGYFSRPVLKPRHKQYLSFFPRISPTDGRCTGEGTVGYFAAPWAPYNLRRLLPNAKLILLLRNPIDRSYSRIHHIFQLFMSRKTPEPRKPDDDSPPPPPPASPMYGFVKDKAAFIDAATSVVFDMVANATMTIVQDCLADAAHLSYFHLRECWMHKHGSAMGEVTSALIERVKKAQDREAGPEVERPITRAAVADAIARGTPMLEAILPAINNAFNVKTLQHSVYYPQLTHWLKAFPRHQLLVLRSEAFYADTFATMDRVTAFLGLTPVDWSQLISGVKFNVLRDDSGIITLVQEPAKASSYNVTASVRQRLANFFRPYNAMLAELVGDPAMAEWE
ncbi:sulfotransferase [Thecamonas trahens ATCC 50062]|uniref:Sulfotransferase n=1 Tax=Thecamonas trahens ATCC 50062 TaxID=461836 RepID=A0A0L0D5V2_THETB|nr:sulfotransferase [Thecamonas trahens ATCC 50062]KNC46688.1 sulfotransferase [Thecamonas trahens ATCC 50062]|eukprot:XP_013760456.1 sulfotransferase [Thecamonas trahens ATCC 50062]